MFIEYDDIYMNIINLISSFACIEHPTSRGEIFGACKSKSFKFMLWEQLFLWTSKLDTICINNLTAARVDSKLVCLARNNDICLKIRQSI